jgi:hypothetical protein
VFSPGGDVLYGTANGHLYWYRFDADTGTWANGGNGRVVGDGWDGSNSSITATTGTCAVPAPAQVGAVTPAPATTGGPLQLAGAAQHYRATYRDAQGRAVELRETSDTTVHAQVLGTTTFASDLSATTAQDQDSTRSLVGLDSSGTAWLSDNTGPVWRRFGKGMKRLALTEGISPSYMPQAVGVDGSGGLWSRRQAHTYSSSGWMPWQRVTGGVSDFRNVAGAFDGAYGVSGDRWFDMFPDPANGYRTKFRDGVLPQSAEVTGVISGEVTYTARVLVAKQTASGEAVYLRGSATGFEPAWRALPALPGGVTLSDAPMSATELAVTGALAIAAVGSDGYVYVTSGLTGTGAFAPWQRVGEPIAGAPQLVTPYFEEVQLGYRGQDGKVYHYGALTPNNTEPLSFYGFGRTES